MKNALLVVRNDEEAVQHAEGQRRHREEVHRSNRFPMIAEKGRPSPCRLRASRRSPHPAQDGLLRNIEAKHSQLAVDARSTPGRVFGNHAENDLTKFRTDSLAAWATSMPREPSPIHFESDTVPANERLRLDENQRLLPSRPEPFKRHPEQSIGSGKSWLRTSLPQESKLLPKRQVFQKQVAVRTEEADR